jgi:DNA-binding MarR family transcriptional regulator
LSAKAKGLLGVLKGKNEKMDAHNNFDLWCSFFLAQNAMSRIRNLELAGIGVTPEQSGALHLLYKNGSSTIGEMATTWLRQRNSVSTLMERMAKQGLVKKIKIPRQRDLEIQITPKGREMHDRIRQYTGQVFESVFTQFSEKDRQDFLRCLSIVLTSSREILDSDDIKNQPQNKYALTKDS